MIEKYNKNRHNPAVVKDLLAMAMGRPTPQKLTQYLEEFYTADNHTLFIALKESRVIGLIAIDCTNSPRGLITHLAITPDMRRKGTGRNLINHAVKSFGLESITAETDQDAVEFYRACGFIIKEIESKWPGVRRFRCVKDTSNDLC